MLPQTFNAKWIKGPKMANRSHQHDGQDEHEQAAEVHQGSVRADVAWQDQEKHARDMAIWQQQQAQIAETEAAVGEPKLEPWHPPLADVPVSGPEPTIHERIKRIRAELDALEAAL